MHNLICEHKKLWIDHVVGGRDALVHPESGLSRVMFALDVVEANEQLVLRKILKPSFGEKEFDVYARETLGMVERFSKGCMKCIKGA